MDPFVIPDFILPDDCERIRDKYNAALATGLKPRGGAVTDAPLARVIKVPEFLALRKQVYDVLKEKFQLEGMLFDYAAFTRMTIGGKHDRHADAVKLDGSPNHTANRVASAMIYLTDSGVDFTGGVLNFPVVPRKIEPKVGLMVGFLTTVEHQHEVSEVTAGMRDAIAFWFKR